jgi:molecular chaperone GrpE
VTKLAKKKEKHKEQEDQDEIIRNGEGDELTNQDKTPEVEVNPIDTLQEELDALNDKYLRLNAEYQNYRKRVEKEKSDIFKFGTEKLFADLLPVMDNFERALKVDDASKTNDKFHEGVLMIKKTFDEFFEKNGVKKIEALGQPFDPEIHHAVLSEESDDVESEHVVEVFQEGYTINDKVIRASMVKVSK